MTSCCCVTRSGLGIIAALGVAFGAGYFVNGIAEDSSAALTQDSVQDRARTASDELKKLQEEARNRVTGTTGQDTGAVPTDDPLMAAMQQVGQPGPFHENLEMLVGDWHGTVKIWMTHDAEPMQSEGDVSRRWVLDKRFVQEKVTAETPDGTFSGLAYVGYNNMTKQYESVWMENMNTAMMIETGVYNADTKSFMFFGNHRMPTGEDRISYSEINVSDPNRHIMTGWAIDAEGNRYKSFEGDFKKVN